MMRFTIRDVLWLTVVAALALAWWVDHRHLAMETTRWKWRFGVVVDHFGPMGWSIYTHNDGVGIGNTNTGHDHQFSKDPF